MNFNNFTIKSQEVIQKAQLIAQENEHQEIQNEHIFKAILTTDENVTPYLLKKLNVNIQLFEQLLDSQLKSYSKVTGGKFSYQEILELP